MTFTCSSQVQVLRDHIFFNCTFWHAQLLFKSSHSRTMYIQKDSCCLHCDRMLNELKHQNKPPLRRFLLRGSSKGEDELHCIQPCYRNRFVRHQLRIKAVLLLFMQPPTLTYCRWINRLFFPMNSSVNICFPWNSSKWQRLKKWHITAVWTGDVVDCCKIRGRTCGKRQVNGIFPQKCSGFGSLDKIFEQKQFFF